MGGRSAPPPNLVPSTGQCDGLPGRLARARWAAQAVRWARPCCGPAGCQAPLTVRGQSNPIAAHPQAQPGVTPWVASVPTEKDKTTLPTYIIEPPDILLIDAVKLVPKAPYHIEALGRAADLGGRHADRSADQRTVSGRSGRSVDLGPAYGKVSILGQTTDEAQATIESPSAKHAQATRGFGQPGPDRRPAADCRRAPGRARRHGQPGHLRHGLRGRPDGGRGQSGHRRAAANYLENPRVSVDVFAYNSKVYYVITEGAGSGDSLVRVPITGNETVLDALAQVNGLSRLSSKNIWISRPAPGGVNCDQILPVNWYEITKGAATATNYQVLPGDRIFIAEDKLIALDNWIDQFTNPMERIFGFSLLGAQTIQTFNRFPKGFGSGGAF